MVLASWTASTKVEGHADTIDTDRAGRSPRRRLDPQR
jgi:hypothetical protein